MSRGTGNDGPDDKYESSVAYATLLVDLYARFSRQNVRILSILQRNIFTYFLQCGKSPKDLLVEYAREQDIHECEAEYSREKINADLDTQGLECNNGEGIYVIKELFKQTLPSLHNSIASF